MEVRAKDELLEQISLAVEQIQKQFVQGGNVIKDCQETFFLCQCVDNILHHGLKEGLISWAVEPTIWPLLEKISCSKDIEEIRMFRFKADKGKCSAWIKMAVNGNLLGSYISTISQDESLLHQHYYEHAFLRDPVMTDTVQSLLNYGIANFDFQISISQSYPSVDISVKQYPEHEVSYDAFEQTRENGYVTPNKIERKFMTGQESWSKKKRKKKKQAVNTVVIADQDDGLDENIDNENYVKGDKNNDPLKNEENLTYINGDEKILKNVNDTQSSNSIESSLTTSDQSDVNTVNNVNNCDSGHVTNSTNKNKADLTADQSDASTESKTQRPVFNGNELDQYLLLNKQKRETKESELDALGRITERPSSRQEFSVNYFFLDETESQTKKANDLTRTELSKESISNVAEDVLMTKAENSSEEPKMDTRATSALRRDSGFMSSQKSDITDPEKEDSNLQKSAKGGIVEVNKKLCGANEEFKGTCSIAQNENALSSPHSRSNKNHEDLSGTSITKAKFSQKSPLNSPNSIPGRMPLNPPKTESGRRISRGRRTSTGESEILSSDQYDYRVRKVENPEFVSSSYGSSSALSDLTDDDKDLNFIPGIHRMSSRSFSSSFEKKSSADNSLSFDQNSFPRIDSSHRIDSLSSQLSSVDDETGRLADVSNEWDMFEDLLNVEEEHFSRPDSFAGLTTIEELEMAIEHYKKMIKKRKDTAQQRELVQKLVKLRLRLQQERDGPPIDNPKFRKILGHHFSKTEGASGTKYFCDQCRKNVWTMWQPLFTCKDCGYHSHRKCLEHIQRPCPNRNLSSVSYILDICPDTGLDAQQYRCAECRKEIAFSSKANLNVYKDDVSEARICDYTGQYFCESCHWNDQITIPARVLRNWDFSQYKVCRKTKQLLELMKSRPILNLEQINPMLYRYVEELREIGKFREDILIMKKYFLTCRDALESKLLIQLEKRQHFVDGADMFSFQDLIDLNNDVLLPEISKVYAMFLAHIKADCELCRARGFICEVCGDSSDIIFAFDPHAVKCKNCSSVFHKICFKPEDCPKCQRRKKAVEETS